MRCYSYKKHYAELFISIIGIFPTINYYLAEFLTSFELPTPSFWFYLIIYGTSAVSYIYIFFRMEIKSLLAVLIAGIIFIFTFIVSPDSYRIALGGEISANYFAVFWFAVFPPFFLTLTKIDLSYLTELFYRFGIVVVILMTVSYAVRIFFIHIPLTNYMSFAYQGLFFVMLCVYVSVKKRKPIRFILSSAACVCIILAGCRGAALTLSVFLAIVILTAPGMKKGIHYVVNLLIINLGLIIFVYAEPIISYFGYLWTAGEVKSRTLAMLLSGEFFSDSGRGDIQRKVIAESGLLPNGLYGDFAASGVYSHNWIVEILCNFGYLIGPIIIFIILFILIKSTVIYRRENSFRFFWTVSAVSMVLVKYMVSSSPLITFEFMFLTGLLVNMLYINNKRDSISGRYIIRIISVWNAK